MTLRPLVVTLSMVFLGSLLACGGATGSGTDGGSGGGTGLSCTTSAAKSGSLCQVNFFCADGGEQAVYCGQERDGGYDCACGPASAKPRSFASPDFCSDLPGARDARAREANTKCGFNL